MATTAASPPRSLAPDRFERLLGWGALLLLTAIVIAVLRGSADWARVPGLVWVHLLTIGLALGLTPLILWNRRGDRRHRQFGYVWVSAMALTALVSLGIRLINEGGFSLIHILSVWTLIQVPLIVWSARAHNHSRHRSAVRGMALGALLIAGFFTFPFDRLLGHWLFG